VPANTNKIGAEEFLEIVGLPDWLQQRLRIVERPGVDGLGVWLTGIRGKPATVRTRVDCFDLAAALAALDRYCAMVGNNPVAMTYAGQDLTGFGVRFQVLGVHPAPDGVRTIAGGVGGLNATSGAWLECDWELVAVAV